ncbi:MAG: DUF2975 domain-containing protein [Devosia nanyangense]|uniref:DUF2975 domain-containing protein n=1 Tax=Devosia nanyangense TaxID=1228055 RepID=A0A933L6G0_9HYPH|nr:DUF2975 domain-containing protein [Devosia nanyangense]
MTDENSLSHLRRMARIGGAVALVGAVGVGGFSLSSWFDQRQLAVTLASGLPGAPMPEGGTLVAAYLLSLVPAAIFVIAMIESWRLFALLGSGRVFTPALPARLRRLGLWAGVSAVAGIVVRTGLGLVLTANAPAGQKALVIGIGSNEIAALVMAALLLAFALVMRDAIAIEEDNRGIV